MRDLVLSTIPSSYISIVLLVPRLLVTMRFPIFTSIVFTLTTHSATAYKPWNGTIPESVNEECRQALSTDIDCPFVLGRDSVESGLYLKDPALAASYCSSSCRSSLRQYFLDFSRACYKEDLLEGLLGLDATVDYALSLFGTQEYLCVADESVAACLDNHVLIKLTFLQGRALS